MKRPVPPTELTEAFREKGLGWYSHGGTGAGERPMRLFDGGPACWLWQFDVLERPCSGDLEAFHFISRQRIRNVLRGQLTTDAFADGAIDPLDVDDLVQLAEWDPRNGGPGCTGHHRRFDSHSTPALQVPIEALPIQALLFAAEWGFESEAERKFGGGLEQAMAWRRENGRTWFDLDAPSGAGAAAGVRQQQQAGASNA